MGRRKGAASGSSSSIESNNHQSFSNQRDLSTDLRLGIAISASQQYNNPYVFSEEQQMDYEQPMQYNSAIVGGGGGGGEDNECNSNATFFVKVYMEGIPIGRKLNLLAHDGYYDLIRTLDQMFSTRILWSETEYGEEETREPCHVLTYEDKEGDWLMVGDVPWEMFLSCVRRLKITRIEM